jgi:hypothetical protein
VRSIIQFWRSYRHHRRTSPNVSIGGTAMPRTDVRSSPTSLTARRGNPKNREKSEKQRGKVKVGQPSSPGLELEPMRRGEGTPWSMISCDPTLTRIHYLYSACLARHERSEVGLVNAAQASAKRVPTTFSAPLDVASPNGTYPSFSDWVNMAFCVFFESPLCF